APSLDECVQGDPIQPGVGARRPIDACAQPLVPCGDVGVLQDLLGLEPRLEDRVDAAVQHGEQLGAVLFEELAQDGQLGDGRTVWHPGTSSPQVNRCWRGGSYRETESL